MNCKRCNSELVTKNGKAREKQRFLCKECGYNFIEGDLRTRPQDSAKRALAIILYTMCKASFNFLGTKLFKVSPSTIMNWVKGAAESIEIPEVAGEIREIEFDEMWHFIGKKKLKDGSSKRLIVAQGELWPGLSAIVILQRSKNFTTK